MNKSARYSALNTFLADYSPHFGQGRLPSALNYLKSRIQVGEIRVLTQNMFGLDEDGDTNCQARARALGSTIAKIANTSTGFDIVELQENWDSWDFGAYDCGADELHSAIRSTNRYNNSNQYYRSRPESSWQINGGLSIYSLHPINRFIENQWDRDPRWINRLHGSTFSRIRLNQGEISVDVYNVHLLGDGDRCDRECRRNELKELRDEIKRYSGTSGNPVIVVGDFNIGGPPSCNGASGYADIMNALENPRDLWLEAHPTQNGFTYDCQNNTVLKARGRCTSSERIDYMFVVTSPKLTNSQFDVVLKPQFLPNQTWVQRNMRIAQFRRPDNGGHVSDHFGLDAQLEIRQRGRQNHAFIGLGNKCMDVSGGRITEENRPVQLWDCNNTIAQRWTLEPNGWIRNIGVNNTRKCLTATQISNGSPMVISDCTSSARQRFDYTGSGQLRSVVDRGLCVDVQWGNTTNGTPIQLWRCNGTAPQLWRDR